MRFVKPAVFMTAKSIPNNEEIRKWLEHVGCDSDVVERYATPTQGKTDSERIIELAGRRCYMSFQPEKLNPNVTKIREEIGEYVENILKAKHGSVLAHCWFTFAIEGVSRVFTGEMNRHGIGTAISEGSMRYIRFTDIPFVQTPMLTLTDAEQNEVAAAYEDNSTDIAAVLPQTLAIKKERTRQLFKRSTEQDEENYKAFCEIWADELKPESKFSDKKHITSLGRRGIPMGVATGGEWSFNVRSLRHMLTMRCDEPAEEEIALVAGMMLERMINEEPHLFGDFHLNERGYFRPTYEKV